MDALRQGMSTSHNTEVINDFARRASKTIAKREAGNRRVRSLFPILVVIATYVGTRLIWMALIGGMVGLVIAYLRAGILCSNVGTGVSPMIKFWSLASVVVVFGWLTVAFAQLLG